MFSGANKSETPYKKEWNRCFYTTTKWLQRQESFSLQRPKKNYKKSRIEEGIDDQRDADLMDMTKFSKFNDGVKFVLLVIYNLFKIHMYEWLRPLENNQGSSVETVLGDVLCGDRILNAKKILTGI